MYLASFIFKAGVYDNEFHHLNSLIEEAAESLPGYLGTDAWRSPNGEKVNSTYYWKDEETLKQFAHHPKHIEAKRQYARWYDGYHVVIAKVERSYGDDYFSHITPNERNRIKVPKIKRDENER